MGDHEVLLDDRRRASDWIAPPPAALDDPELAAHVRAEQRQAIDMNVTGVPAMVVEGKFMIPGAQEPEIYANALRRVASRV